MEQCIVSNSVLIVAGRGADELLKFAQEVGLVAEPKVKRQIAKGNITLCMDAGQRRLAAQNAAKGFWRQTGILAELPLNGAAGITGQGFQLVDANIAPLLAHRVDDKGRYR